MFGLSSIFIIFTFAQGCYRSHSVFKSPSRTLEPPARPAMLTGLNMMATDEVKVNHFKMMMRDRLKKMRKLEKVPINPD